MKTLCMSLCIVLLHAISAGAQDQANEPPVIPVGLDAFRMWDHWAYQRIGARAYMRSTYDREGSNRSADASHFLYREGDDFHVSLDTLGPGVLYFKRTNHWHGSPWHYEVDGADHIVQETSTADPDNPVPNSVFIPENLFPGPLTYTWSTTKGADLMWVPIPFEDHLRLAYSRTHYGTGYYIYKQYVPGANLSQPIVSWDAETPPGKDVLELIERSGTPLVEVGNGIEAILQGQVDLPAGTVRAWTHAADPSMVRGVSLVIPRKQALEFGNMRLRVFWDGREDASIDAPVSLFFGAGRLYNRDNREYLVKGFPMYIRYTGDQVHMACYFPMPFFRSMRVVLDNSQGETDFEDIHLKVLAEPYNGPANHVGYFHATYRDHPEPELGKDLVLLDTRGTEGEEEWSGSFVGTSFIFSHDGILRTLEGDPRFLFDDCQTPSYGTGTEEWGGGGDYWGGRTMTLPFAGHPTGAPRPEDAQNDVDLIQSAYRFLLSDLFPFGNRAVIQLEHGGRNESEEHYETVTYWYGIPRPSLVKTDELDVGSDASESAHDYDSPDASTPQEVISRYEWGTDEYKWINWEHPLAHAHDYADFRFMADAGKTYYLWTRGRPLIRHEGLDSFWVQFDDDIGTESRSESYAHDEGMGNWYDGQKTLTYSWASGRPGEPPLSVTFAESGTHRLRIQTRQTLHLVDQIWLSGTQQEQPNGSAAMARPESVTPGRIDEIVLDTNDAIVVEGAVNIVPEPEASTGRAFLMDCGAAKDLIPTLTKTGRTTTGASTFTMNLQPDNHGVLLRRTLDYQYPNQQADVYVADGAAPRGQAKWERAGTWYTAGSNTCLFSDPHKELGAAQETVITSNRRFRDAEFLIPKALTQGRESIHVRTVFKPVERELFPGHPFPNQTRWSAFAYQAYCYVMPDWGVD